MLEGKDFLLLVVAAAEAEPLTPVQLQKALFLINESNLPEAPANEPLYNFQPYHYGPFDAQIYSDADELKQDGLVLRIASNSGGWTETTITPAGLRRIEDLKKKLAEPSEQYIDKLVAWVQSQTFRGLVGAVYDLFPQYRENSVFQD